MSLITENHKLTILGSLTVELAQSNDYHYETHLHEIQ